MKTQVVIDLYRHAEVRWINHIIEQFRQTPSEHFVPDLSPIVWMERLGAYGIEYLAPADVRNSGLGAGSIDLISTTSVLEHIPVVELTAIMKEMRRVCSAEALPSMLVDYEDHYGQRGSDAGIYNFLQFSDRQWARYNPSNHYQNRLRHSDYAKLFRDCGFEILEVEVSYPDDWMDMIAEIKLDARFSKYNLSDLGITRGEISA